MRRAIAIGIDNYPSFPLKSCIKDATRFAEAIRLNGDGAPNFEVKIETDLERSQLKELAEKLFAGEPEMALFYFSGHGFLNGTGGHLVTIDAKRYDEGVSMDDLLKLANQSKARQKIVILDCCHSGAMGNPSINGSSTALLSEGLSVLTASRTDEAAMADDTESVFTALILDGLAGGAADLRGNITPGSLYAYVDEALGAWDQRPIFKTNISSFAAIKKVAPKITSETLRKIIGYFNTPTSEHNLDPSYEFTHSSADPIKVAIFKDLQKFESVGLVIPVGEEHMYFAAINSKSCKLTAYGHQYWRLAKEGKI